MTGQAGHRPTKLVDLSDERRTKKTWLPPDDRDVTNGLVSLNALGWPVCYRHGAMNRVDHIRHIYRCQEMYCGVGGELVEYTEEELIYHAPPIQLNLVAQIEPIQRYNGRGYAGNLSRLAEGLCAYFAGNLEQFAESRFADVMAIVVLKRGGEIASQKYTSGHYAEEQQYCETSNAHSNDTVPN